MDSERAGSQTECRAHCGPHGGVTLTDFYQKPEQGLVPDVQPRPRLLCSDTQRKLLAAVPGSVLMLIC